MLYFLPSQTLPTPVFGTMKRPNPFSCFSFRLLKPFPPHAWEPRSTQPLFHASSLAFPNHFHNTLGNQFEPSQALPTPRLWTMKHPTPFSCFIFGLPKPFPPHSWEPWSTQTLFHASFWAFPNPSHPTLRNSCFVFSLPKPFPPHAREPRSTQPIFHASSLAFPNPFHNTLGNQFEPSQALPTPRLWTMKHPTPFSCFIFGLPKPFPPHSWEPWSTQTLFHASFWTFPKPNSFSMLHFGPSQALPTPLLWTMKHSTPFSRFILNLPKHFPPHSWEPWSTQTLFHASFWAFPDPSHPTLENHEKHPTPFSRFILNLPKPFPPHSWEPRSTQLLFPLHSWETRSTELLFHASFLAFPNHSHPALGNHVAPKPFFMVRFNFSETLPTRFLRSIGSPNSFSYLILSHPWFWAIPTPSHSTLEKNSKQNSTYETLKENVLCQVCLVKCRFAKTSWQRTCFVIFVKYAWWNAVLQKQAEREHALSSMPGEMPIFAKTSWQRTCFVIFVKYAWWNAVLQDKLKENVLCQVCLVKSSFAKTSWKRTCLEPQKGLGWSRRCQGQNADQGGLNPTVTQLHLRRPAPPDPLNSLRSHQ